MSLGLSPLGLTPLGLAPQPASGDTTTTSVLPGAGILGLSGYAPTISQTANQGIAPGTGSVTLTGYAPSVSQSTTTGIAPGTGVLTFAGYSPSISQTANNRATPGAAALALTGYAPSVSQSANSGISPAPAALSLTGYAPAVAQSANQWLTPGAGSLALTGFAPSITQAPPPADPRYARPALDVSAGSWAPSSGASLAAMLSEVSPDSSTYIQTTSASICEIQLGAVVDPQTSSGQVVRYMAGSDTGSSLTVRLKQGAAIIAEWTHSSLPVADTVFEQILTAKQCDSITNYADLRLSFEAA